MANTTINKTKYPVVKGSYVAITGGKYSGYFAEVLSFTVTGQCRIQLDHGRNRSPGAIATKNQKTRCLRHHVEVAPRPPEGSSSTPDVDSELDLLARLVALKLNILDDGCSDSAEVKLESFIASVRLLSKGWS
jgi:hypothetical protein